MEFELDRTQINGFDILLDTTLRPEETLEMIVPDACPDIQRIVETDGKVLLRTKEAMEGRVEVAGSFQLSVIYVPDGESGLRHLDAVIPFTCAAEDGAITSGCITAVQARLCRADARAINPRKILIRAEAALAVSAFLPRREEICGRILNGEEAHVEQLIESREVYLTACVQEKPFSLSDEISISSSRPAAVEILKSRVSLACGDSKIIGNKLIFKGSAIVSLFYRGEGEGVYPLTAELPVSQIMEVSDVSEEAECDLALTLTGAECVLAPGGDGRTVDLHLEALAQAVVRETRSLEVLVDAYSTAAPLVAESACCSVTGRVDRGSRSQNVREVLEASGGMREILDCRLAIGEILQSREGEQQIFTAQTEVQILYGDEEGSLFSARYPLTVSCALELPDNCRCLCDCETVGDVYAAPTSGGIEVRFALDFHYCAMVGREITALTQLLPGEPPEAAGEQPSLVLRTLEQGERLWDMAKAYGTTVSDIISANELTDEGDAGGKLLLIPGRR